MGDSGTLVDMLRRPNGTIFSQMTYYFTHLVHMTGVTEGCDTSTRPGNGQYKRNI